MKIDPDLRRRTLRAAIALLETAHDPEHVFPHAVPLLDALGSSPLSSTGAPGLRRISCGPCRRAASASFTRRGSIGPGAYLQQRLHFTHDLHHTVLPIPVDVPGLAPF